MKPLIQMNSNLSLFQMHIVMQGYASEPLLKRIVSLRSHLKVFVILLFSRKKCTHGIRRLT